MSHVTIGSQWQNRDGHLLMVLGRDPSTGSYRVFDYVDDTTRFAPLEQWQDGLFTEAVFAHSAESEEFERYKERLNGKLFDAFSAVGAQTSGDPIAMHKTSDGVSHDYETVFFGCHPPKLTRPVLESFVTRAAQAIALRLERCAITELIWRSYPELGIAHDACTGIKTVAVYARVLALCNADRVCLRFSEAGKFHDVYMTEEADWIC